MSGLGPSITPARDAAERAIASMRREMSGDLPDEVAAMSRDLQLDAISLMIRFFADMSDRGVQDAQAFGAIERAISGALSSVLMSYSSGDRDKATSLIQPLLVDIANQITIKVGKPVFINEPAADPAVYQRTGRA